MVEMFVNALDDPGLHLVTDHGEVLHPVSRKAGRYVFLLPETVGSLRLRSRAARPVDGGPLLGVRVGALILTRGGRAVALRADGAANGWHAAGAEPGRWTDGDAALTIPGNYGLKLPGVLQIELLAVAPRGQAALSDVTT